MVGKTITIIMCMGIKGLVKLKGAVIYKITLWVFYIGSELWMFCVILQYNILYKLI